MGQPGEPAHSSANRAGGGAASPRAFFLSPEGATPGCGGGSLRSACLAEYLRRKYTVDVAGFELPPHSKATGARIWRNGLRLLRGRPPLFDRYSGFEDQIAAQIRGRYTVAVIEHFWCAAYAEVLRPHADLLVLDLHNIESELAWSHANATRGLESLAFRRFAAAYRRLDQDWLRRFDLILAVSAEDARRVKNAVNHPNVQVFPNALPEIPRPDVAETNSMVFSGNLEYHPNVEAVRWFRSRVWPLVRESCPTLEWQLIGRHPEAIRRLVDGDERIRVIGPVENAVETLASAKICIVPLRSGSGTRFKILEAWAAARAVVSTSIGAEGLGAEPGRHVLLADRPEAFAEAIASLNAEPALRARLGAAGRELYLDRYVWSKAWQALERAGL